MFLICEAKAKGVYQAKIEPAFRTGNKFEVGLAELFIESWQPDQAFIQLYENKKLIVSQRLSSNNIEKSLLEFASKITAENVSVSVQFGVVDFAAQDSFTFKVNESAQKILDINNGYFKTLKKTIPSQPPYFSQLHLASDIVGDQIIGDRKRSLLRTLFLARTSSIHINFSNLHYVDISKSLLNQVTVWFEDSEFNPIVIPGKVFVKLHIRTKK